SGGVHKLEKRMFADDIQVTCERMAGVIERGRPIGKVLPLQVLAGQVCRANGFPDPEFLYSPVNLVMSLDQLPEPADENRQCHPKEPLGTKSPRQINECQSRYKAAETYHGQAAAEPVERGNFLLQPPHLVLECLPKGIACVRL